MIRAAVVRSEPAWRGLRRAFTAWRWRRILPALAAVLLCPPLAAQTSVTDDSGARLTVHAPVRRIVSLGADAGELLIAAGAGAWIVAVAAADGDPPGLATGVTRLAIDDLDRVVGLRPDLVVASDAAAAQAAATRLRARGLAVYQFVPRVWEDIAITIEKLGWLARSEDLARLTALSMREQWQKLAEAAAGQTRLRVRVDYGTVPRAFVRRFVDDALAICGGDPVFSSGEADNGQARPPPQLILGIGTDETWRQMSAATEVGAVYAVDPAGFAHATPRILPAAVQLCDALRQARLRLLPIRGNGHDSTAFPHGAAGD